MSMHDYNRAYIQRVVAPSVTSGKVPAALANTCAAADCNSPKQEQSQFCSVNCEKRTYETQP